MEQFKINRASYSIHAMENPTTPIVHKGDALQKNLGEKDKEGKVILPAAKVNNPK